MAFIGNLAARLTVNSSQFSSGLRKASANVQTFSGQVEKTGGTIKRALGGAFALIGGIGFGAMLKREFEDVDALVKLSRQLDISTDSLQGLRHAANLTGPGMDAMDAGLKTLSKRLGEASRGSGAAVPALRDLAEVGLDMDKIFTMDPTEAFLEISDAIRKIDNPLKRNAIAANLFSKANQGLLLTLMAGRGELAKYQQEVEDTGATLTDTEKQAMEDVNDAMTRLKLGTKSLSQSLAVALAPSIEKIAEAIGGLAKWLADMDQDTKQAIGSWLKFGVTLAGAKMVLPIVTGLVGGLAAALKSLVGIRLGKGALGFLASKKGADLLAKAGTGAAAAKGATAASGGIATALALPAAAGAAAGAGIAKVASDIRGMETEFAPLKGLAATWRDIKGLFSRNEPAEGIKQLGDNAKAATPELSQAQIQAQRVADAIDEINNSLQDTASMEDAVGWMKKLKADIELSGFDGIEREYERLKRGGAFGEPIEVQIQAKLDEMVAANATLKDMHAAIENIKSQDLEGQARELMEQHKAIKAADEATEAHRKTIEDLQKDMASVFESTRTPMERFEQDVSRLNDMLNHGLDFATYTRAIDDVRNTLVSAIREEAERQFPAGSISGTRKGTREEILSRREDRNEMQRQRWIQQQLAEARKQTELQSGIKQALSNQTSPETVQM